MKKIILLTSALCAGIWYTGFAQFQQGVGDSLNQRAQSVQQVSGGYLTGGLYRPGPLGLIDANLTRTDFNGNTLWTTVIGGVDEDAFTSVREVNVPGTTIQFIAAGYTDSFGFGNDDMYLVGVNGAGFPVFSRVYGGSALDQAHCLQRIINPNQQPGYALIGETRSFPNLIPDANIYIVRTALNGNSLDQVVIGTPGKDIGYWIEQTQDGGYLITGTTTYRCANDTISNGNIFVARLDPFMNLLWDRIIAGPGSGTDIGFCVRENPLDQTVIVTGSTTSFGNGTESFLLNLSAAGTFNWMKVYGLKRIESGQNVLLTRGMNDKPQYIVSGYSNSYDSLGNFDPMIYKTDLMGNLLVTGIYGGPSNDYGFEIDEAPGFANLPNYILTGINQSFTNGATDILLLETTNSLQSISPCEIFPNQLERRVQPCIIKGARYVHLNPWMAVTSGFMQLNYNEVSCTTPAPWYSQSVPSPGLTPRPVVPSTITVGPNPVTSLAELITDTSYAGSKLAVVDSNGTVVYTATLSGTSDSMDLSDLAPGLYVARIMKPDGSVISIRVVKK